MAPSFDCLSSSLFCAEDNSSILGFDEGRDEVDNGVNDGEERYQTGDNHNQYRWADFLMDYPVQTEECLGLMIENEWQHMPGEYYLMSLQRGTLDSSLRGEAIDWIWKVHAHYSFGPLSLYLSVNYLDRFLSSCELYKSKPWMMQLLSVACLSLAAKMEEISVPLALDLQVCDSKFIFEAKTIQRMELLVLSILKWRMQSVTPFSFIDFLLHKINDDKPPSRSSLSRAVQLILSTIKGVDFLEFRPSEVAAAVAISVSVECQTSNFSKALSCCIQVEKGRAVRCYELIQELALGSAQGCHGSAMAEPNSPNGVLDASCLTYKSDDLAAVASCASSHTSPAAKRRKMNR